MPVAQQVSELVHDDSAGVVVGEAPDGRALEVDLRLGGEAPGEQGARHRAAQVGPPDAPNVAAIAAKSRKLELSAHPGPVAVGDSQRLAHIGAGDAGVCAVGRDRGPGPRHEGNEAEDRGDGPQTCRRAGHGALPASSSDWPAAPTAHWGWTNSPRPSGNTQAQLTFQRLAQSPSSRIAGCSSTPMSVSSYETRGGVPP